MQIVHTITETSGESAKLFNAAHVYSTLNRKMLEPVDSQGNAQAFALNIKVYSDGANKATFMTASNSYVTKQAVKAWFRVWKAKFIEQGHSMKDLGPYGRVFKPRFKVSDSFFGSGDDLGRGEWNYSDIVTTPPSTGGTSDIAGNEIIDQYSLHLIGDSVLENTGQDETRQYSSVGMIQSWLGSRKQPVGADGSSAVPEDLVFDQDNPLLLARGGSLTSEMMLDEVRDLQKDEPPYDNVLMSEPYTQAIVRSNADLFGECDILAPLGFVQISTTAACTLVFTLVGIGDM